MLPSIGYAPQAQNRPVSADTARHSGPASDGSFDQVFASTARGHDREADAGDDDKTAASEAAGQAPIGKPPAPGQSVAKQAGAPATEIEASASAGNPASLVSTVSRPVEGFAASAAAAPSERKPETAPSAGPKRPAASDSPAADPLAAHAAAACGAPLDPSSLAMLLGAGAARFVNPAAAGPGAPANAAESPAGNETQAITGLTPPRESAATPGAGLAFALRLSRQAPVTPADDASSGAPSAGATLSSFAGELEAAAAKAIAGSKPRDPAESAAGASPAGPAVLETATAAPAGNTPAPSAPTASNAAKAEPPELPAPPNEPLRAVRVELASDSNQRVAVTLVERGGALSVSVRSADSNLARSLQEHLPDLSARLTEQRYQTEVWTPGVPLPAASRPAEAGHGNFESGGGKQGGQDGSSNSGQQQDRREREAPEWFEELAAIGRTPQIRSEYLWVQ